MKTIVLAIVLLTAAPAFASGVEIEAGFFTHHWISEGVNNDTELFGIYYRGFELGTMRNSFGDRSYIAGYRFEIGRSFSLSVGGIHGYGENAKVYLVHFDEIVLYPSINYTHDLANHFAVRFRQMAEVSLLSAVFKLN